MTQENRAIWIIRLSLPIFVVSILTISCVAKDVDRKGDENKETEAATGDGEEIHQGSVAASNRDDAVQASDGRAQAGDAGSRESATDPITQAEEGGARPDRDASGEPAEDASADTLDKLDAGTNETCFFNYKAMNTLTLFTAYGICQSPDEACVGGTPEAFDLSGVFSGESSNLLPPPPDPAANCQNGLICCVKTDQCESVNNQITSAGLLTTLYPGIAISCAATGTCAGANVKELALGCPRGEGCCVDLPSLAVESGAPSSADAGI